MHHATVSVAELRFACRDGQGYKPETMKTDYKFWTLFIIGVGLGLLIGWIDSRPTWDDTGITVGMVLGVTSILGFVMPSRAWVWALTVGVWVPLWNILLNNSYAPAFALLVAFIGAYIGALLRKLLLPLTSSHPNKSR